jgi:hypothetical protein
MSTDLRAGRRVRLGTARRSTRRKRRSRAKRTARAAARARRGAPQQKSAKCRETERNRRDLNEEAERLLVRPQSFSLDTAAVVEHHTASTCV